MVKFAPSLVGRKHGQRRAQRRRSARVDAPAMLTGTPAEEERIPAHPLHGVFLLFLSVPG